MQWTTTSSPIQGKSSGVLTKPASNTQGEGVSYAFTVDGAGKGRVLTISGLYQIISGTYSGGSSTTDSDVEIYIYDVDAGVVMQPAGYKLDGGVSGINYPINATFQTSTTSTNYRLLLHTATVSASAYSIKLDSIKIGVNNRSQGPPVTDWTPYTPTMTGFGTVTNNTAEWRRVGDTLQAKGHFLVGVPQATIAYIGLPPGLNFDPAKAFGSSNLTQSRSFGQIWRSLATGATTSYPATNIGPWSLTGTGGTTNAVAISPYTSASGNTFNISNGDVVSVGGDGFGWEISVPIQGWSSNLTISSDVGTRAAIFSTTAIPTAPLANSSFVLVTFTAAGVDTVGGFSSGVYTIKDAGYYDLDFDITLTGSFATYGGAYAGFKINSGTTLYRYNEVSGSTGIMTAGSHVTGIYLSAGATIQPTVETVGWTTVAVGADTSMHFFGVKKSAQGSQQIAASESVNASYRTSAGQVIPNATFTPITFATKEYDSHGAFSGTSYTVPVSGKYEFVGSLFWTNTTNAAFDAQIAIYKNGTLFRAVSTPKAGNAGVPLTVNGTLTAACVAGDVITIYGYQSAGFSLALSADPNYNWITIKRIGN